MVEIMVSHKMTFTQQQIKAAYKRLLPEVQDLIMSNETTELITTSLKEVGLSEEQANLADSEILYALYCLQSLGDAINNIAKLSNKNSNDLSKLKSVIQDNILSKYKINIKDFIESNKTSVATAQPSIEKASVPEIPPTNLPMVEKGEVAHEVPHVEQPVITPTTPIPPPSTTPPQPQTKLEPKASLPDYRYPGGKDPYREPLV